LLYGVPGLINQTGLSITNKGILNFATGQTFPGTGSGTVTSVATGAGLTGGPITTSGTLTIDPTVVPQLNTPNTFTGNQTVNGNVTAIDVTATQSVRGCPQCRDQHWSGRYPLRLRLGCKPERAYRVCGKYHDTGISNTASGYQSLFLNTTGSYNTAMGMDALYYNTTGQNNVAFGVNAGTTVDYSSMTADNNTFVGGNSAVSTGTITNATAIGAHAEVTASNALVLGSINGVNAATASTNIGIGTTAPSNVFTIAQAERDRGDAQQARIARLISQVKAIQAALKTNSGAHPEVRTVKAEGTTVRL
jgi:hypothetical protein